MTDCEIVEAPAFCLHCGTPVMVECRYEDHWFLVWCPECESQRDEFTREELNVYEKALAKWFAGRMDNYYTEKAEDRAMAAQMRYCR